MATENTELKSENTQAQTTPETTDWRSQPGAIAMANQIKKLQEALDAKAAAEAKAQQEAQERKLKEAGDYEALKASLEADAKTKIAAAQSEVRRAKIEALAAGILDEDAREGVIAKMERLGAEDDLSKWLNDYKAAKPHLWQQSVIGPLVGGQQSGGRPNTSDGNEWTAVKADFEGKDPKKVAAAFQKVEQYRITNGKLPPGF